MGLDLSYWSTGYTVISVEPRTDDCTGLVVPVFQLREAGVITPKGRNEFSYIEQSIRQVAAKYPSLSKVVPKETLIATDPEITKVLRKVHKAAWEALPGFDLRNVNPSTVKKLVGGHGRANKDEVAIGVRRMCNLPDHYQFVTNDSSDAAGICLAFLMENYYPAEIPLPFAK
ncbi:crossover junction endodeoxyribonuclease RuvC [Alicyclobacillus cycloheptanicus]|nr:crossover junction endodeoxyribonuclease RuvC [Alicyclobacillus cycloheptanicus]